MSESLSMLFANVPQIPFVSLLLANAGVPFFTTNVYWQITLLIPIILIEVFVHSMTLKINFFKSLGMSCVTNILSTLVGVIIVFGFGILFMVGDSFNPPLSNDSFSRFVILRLVGLLLMWVVSIRVELRLGLRLMQGIVKEIIKRSFLIANTLSYLFLAVVMTYSIIASLSEARNSIASIQRDLTEFEQVCPVIVKSDSCDRVFHERIKSYNALSRIYVRHNTLRKSFDIQVQIAELREATAMTCSQNDQRSVCKETE